MKLTEEHGLRAMKEHASDRGKLIRARYGPEYSLNALFTLIQDREVVRFPADIRFDADLLEPGELAHAIQLDQNADKTFVIAVHPSLERDAHAVSLAVFYQLVRINYGIHATREHAESLGAAALGLSEDSYYEQLCHLADSLPS